ncbi:hypothetical protein JGU66_12770 [Myxococcaceae bacterium JPH2]|nr:hypothetical protein [Myxococcaceae bacterium JPH2]
MHKLRLLSGVAAAVCAVVVPQVALAQVPSYSDPVVYTVDTGAFPATTYPSGYQLDNNYPWKSSYPFSPNYTTSEQQLIINQEVALTHGTLGTDPADGKPNITIDQGVIPEANTQNVQPAVTVTNDSASLPTGNQPFTKSYFRNEGFGNSLFGAGYVIDASMTATPSTGVGEKRVEAYAEGKVTATAFSFQKEIVRGRAEISGQQGGNNSGTAKVYAMGQQIWSGNLFYSFEITPINWSRTFFSASKTFMVGPVPVRVAASVSGGVKLTVTGQIGPTVARLTATPGGWANVTASAGVDIIIAGFGVEGSLTLININLPAFAELFWPFYSLDWTLKATLNLNALSGTLKLYVRIGFWIFKKTWWLTIASWGGINQSWNLYTNNGSLILGMDPMGM